MSTVVNTAAGVVSAAEQPSAAGGCALPLGTRLSEFEIEAVLGAGGFGIVYLALDHSLGRRVAIKEYVPSSLAVRTKGTTLSLRSAADAQTFAVGLRSFINEAHLLASFDHPSLVKVHRFWEQNGTAYMAMPYYDGRTLKQVRDTLGHAPDEAWLQGLLQPLLGALEVLHNQHVYHRDISPDNIMLLPDGRPLLLDFGSARRVMGDGSKALTAILKPNFAPVEQYADMASFPQGPWTDLYAVGAVVYYMLTDEAPMPAALRAMRDELPLLSAPERPAFVDVSKRLLASIDWAMAVNPEDRPVSVAQFRQALNGEIEPRVVPRRGVTTGPAPVCPEGFWPVSTLDAPTAPQQRKSSASRVIAAVAGVVLCTAALATWTLGERDAPPALAMAAASPAVVSVASASPSARAAPVEAMAPAPVAAARAASATAVAVLSSKPKAAAAASAVRLKATTPPLDSHALDECADKNFVMKAICMRRACEQPQLRDQPRCAELRADDDARLQSQVNR